MEADESIYCETDRTIKANVLPWGFNVSAHNGTAEENSLTDPRSCVQPL